MTLTALQRLVVIAILAMFGGMILDIVDAFAVPDWGWVVLPLALMLASWRLLPGFRQLQQAERRHG